MASTRDEALIELGMVTERLASNRNQLADLEAIAHRQRIEAWFAHPGQTISERDRVAEFNTLDLADDIIRLKGEVAADEDRRILIQATLTWADD